MRTTILLVLFITLSTWQLTAQNEQNTYEWSIECVDENGKQSYMEWSENEDYLTCVYEDGSMIFEGNANSQSLSTNKKLGNLSKLAVDKKTDCQPYRITKISFVETNGVLTSRIEFEMTESGKKDFATASVKTN